MKPDVNLFGVQPQHGHDTLPMMLHKWQLVHSAGLNIVGFG
jgi:hypothetical protein